MGCQVYKDFPKVTEGSWPITIREPEWEWYVVEAYRADLCEIKRNQGGKWVSYFIGERK